MFESDKILKKSQVGRNPTAPPRLHRLPTLSPACVFYFLIPILQVKVGTIFKFKAICTFFNLGGLVKEVVGNGAGAAVGRDGEEVESVSWHFMQGFYSFERQNYTLTHCLVFGEYYNKYHTPSFIQRYSSYDTNKYATKKAKQNIRNSNSF